MFSYLLNNNRSKTRRKDRKFETQHFLDKKYTLDNELIK